MTLEEWLPQAEQRLVAAGINAPRLEARLLAAHVLDSDWTSVFAHPEWTLDSDSAEALLERRERREPLAYILGWREFFGRRFTVNPSVLIPRQETETLVDEALARVSEGSEAQVLDLCSGSGCIGITLKLERPTASVLGTDLSLGALCTARANAERLSADVPFIRSDLFEKMDWRRFDLIVCNPPYIAIGEEVMADVARYEPEIALFAGETGLEIYERIAAEGRPFLSSSGSILLEVGHRQASDVKDLFLGCGWTHEATVADLAGIDRVLAFR